MLKFLSFFIKQSKAAEAKKSRTLATICRQASQLKKDNQLRRNDLKIEKSIIS